MTLILNGTDNSATTPAVTGTDTDTGVYYPAANQVALATNGTLALIVDASQNVGIGTSSPNSVLNVVGAQTTFDTNVFGQMLVRSTAAYNATPRAGIAFSVRYNSAGNFIAGGSSIQGYKQNASDGDFGNGLLFTTQADGSAPAERARINSNGEFSIGKTVASESYFTGNGYGFAASSVDPFFSVVNVNASGLNACIYLNKRNTTGTNGLMTFLSNNGSSQVPVGSISHNGSNTSYNTSSDYRLKESVAPMTGALATVAQLKPCTYVWKSTGLAGQGFIAHELQAVMPDAVVGEKDELDKDGEIKPQGIDTSYLVATLTAAIQEQQALITTMSERITALEAK